MIWLLGAATICIVIVFARIVWDCIVTLAQEMMTCASNQVPEVRIVMSLTTSPKRISQVHHAIDSIKQGSIVPDAIVVNLPVVFKRDGSTFKAIPDRLLDDPLVTLNFCEDVGPATKIVPTLKLEKQPDTLIVTMDDDICYPPHHLKKLYAASLRKPGCVITGQSGMPGYLLEGFSGVLYPRAVFGSDEDVIDLERQLRRTSRPCYLSDDFFLSNHLLKRGVELVPCHTPFQGQLLRWAGRGVRPLPHGELGDALHKGADASSGGNKDNYEQCRAHLSDTGRLVAGYPAAFPSIY